MAMKEEVKSKRPIRWMAIFLALLVIGAIVLALTWKKEPGAAVEGPAVNPPPSTPAPGQTAKP
jgi:hypothetical protein